MRPHFLPPSVLWHFEDCETDKSEGDILTAANKNRPKMSLAIRRLDGSKISQMEYANVRRSADLVVTKLHSLIASDPRMSARIGNPKLRTKTFIKSTFGPQYRQAVLELEAEHKLLRLCSAHWKAEVMIGQAFLRRGDTDSKAAANQTQISSQTLPLNVAADDPPLELPAPTLLQFRDVAPVNAAKRMLEMSPGPKSPSARQAQKRSRDDTTIRKPSSHSVPQRSYFFFSFTTFKSTNSCTEHQRPTAPKLVPSFLGRTEMVDEESDVMPSHVSMSCPSPPLSAVSNNISGASISYFFSLPF